MKKYGVSLSLITVLLFTFTLIAQPGKDRRPARNFPAGMLELTEEQQAQMVELRLNLQKEIIPLRSEIKKLRDEMNIELTAEKFNEAKVSKLNDQIADLEKQIRMKRLLNQRAVRDMLPVEQQKRYDLHLLSRGNRDGAWGRQAAPRYRQYWPDFPQEQE